MAGTLGASANGAASASWEYRPCLPASWDSGEIMSAKGLVSLGKVTQTRGTIATCSLFRPEMSITQRLAKRAMLVRQGARGGFRALSGLFASVNTHSRAERKFDVCSSLSCAIRPGGSPGPQKTQS